MSADVAQVVNFALAVLNFAVAALLVLRGFAVSREIGAASVTAAAQSAHEELLDSRSGVSSPEEAERFFDRFWAGQILQYEQWRRGLIPDLIYADWLLRRREQYAGNASLGGVSFQAAWAKRLEVRYQKTRFGAFIQRVFAGDASGDAHGDMLKVRRAMRWARGALWG
jgi:hypothetical protein